MQTPTRSGLHPMLWVAAIAVTLFSLVGIGALTGMIGKSTQPEEASSVLASKEPTLVATPAEPAPPAPVTVQEEAHKPAASAPKPAPQAKPRPTAKASTSAAGSPPPVEQSGTPVTLCANCGVVDSVKPVEVKGEGSGVGAVAGGVLGGALGHQVGKGSGNTLATIAGAVAGGYAGHQVEKNVRTTTQYQVTVRMDDGSRRVLNRKEPPAWRAGDRVEIGPDGEISAAPAASGGRASF